MLLAALLSVSLAALPLDAPARLPAPGASPLQWRTEPYQGGPIPENAHVMNRDHSGWIVGGGLTLVLSYSLTSAVAALALPMVMGQQLNNDTGFDLSPMALLLPVVGPFVSFGFHQASSHPAQTSILLRTFSLISGVLQTGGLVMAAVGYLTQGMVLVYDEEEVTAQLLPAAPGSIAGLCLQLRWP